MSLGGLTGIGKAARSSARTDLRRDAEGLYSGRFVGIADRRTDSLRAGSMSRTALRPVYDTPGGSGARVQGAKLCSFRSRKFVFGLGRARAFGGI